MKWSSPHSKRVWKAVFGCILKNDSMISVCFQSKPFNIMVIQVYDPTSKAEEVEVEWFWLTRPSRTNTQKRGPFHHRGLECKSRKSRDTWSNGQVWPWSTEWSRQRLTELCQENALVIASTLFQQHKSRLHMDTTRWLTLKSDWLYSLQPKVEKLYTVSKNKTRSCGSDHELLIAQFRLKLKKVKKTTRPFRYDLNKIP